MTYGLEFLGLPRRPGKPRQSGITIARDWGFGVGEAKEVVSTLGEYLDYIKIRQWAVWYQDIELTREKISIYSDGNIVAFPGGIVFEVAHVRNRLQRTLDALVDLGFRAIEISDNIVEMSLDEKRKSVALAASSGLEVFFEYGKKYPDAAFDVASAATEIREVLEAGAKRVILERSQLDVTLGPDAAGVEKGRILELVDEVGIQNLVFEAETVEHQMWLISQFGIDVNLGPNITPEHVGQKLEPARYGIGRDEGYSLFESLDRVALVDELS